MPWEWVRPRLVGAGEGQRSRCPQPSPLAAACIHPPQPLHVLPDGQNELKELNHLLFLRL